MSEAYRSEVLLFDSADFLLKEESNFKTLSLASQDSEGSAPLYILYIHRFKCGLQNRALLAGASRGAHYAGSRSLSGLGLVVVL